MEYEKIVNRDFPDFIIVGVQKAGTTKLHSILMETEGVYLPSLRKEINFFNKHYGKGLEWYKTLFKSESSKDSICGEVSPEYINSKEAIERIRLCCPDVKIVVSLRNPVERALSHYKHLIRTQGIKLDFEDALRVYPEILLWGKYRSALNELYEQFPKENVYLCVFEDFVLHPSKELKSLFRFLGVNSEFETRDSEEKNYSFYLPKFHRLYVLLRKISGLLRRVGMDSLVERSKPSVTRLLGRKQSSSFQIEQSTRNMLLDYYSEDIVFVQEKLNRPSSFWLASKG